ncbi:XRE family transcriptional regulator [Streptomyces sp. RB6PN25]|uniref:XRE family transcriptional regulator n=1 Tax=Streptomyces humicola TaxID=2953240 RepID=A0ABT1PTY2_9ACTN|nr:XRE family transcriptional regulator [Streptomyces humicola]MCQ4081136.1 XRE family transcriptional regulator [Streptomyces humicola]
MTPAALASAVDVDPKSVERWIGGRMPYRRHRFAVATFLGVDEGYLWPDALPRQQVASASESEIVNVYPHRWAVPRDAWGRLFATAEHEIGVLVYSGLFLAEDTGVLRTFAEKARSGIRVRILLGDPDSEHVANRGVDEGIHDAMAAKIRNVMVLYDRAIGRVDGIELRLHDTVLYNSIYRADDQVLVNTHVYGFAASHAPILHLKHIPGGEMVNTYLESFERVWTQAKPLT